MENRRKKCRRVGLLLLTLLVCTLLSQQASAQTWYPTVSFGAAYIQDWDDKDCLPESNLNWLYYTKPTVQYFAYKMEALNHKRHFVFGNKFAEASDIVEDDFYYYGADGNYGDANDMYVYAGHGNSDATDFWATMCVGSYRNLSDAERRYRSRFYAAANRWGERSLYLSERQKSQGKMRWAIMNTCYSMPKNPHRVWEKTLGPRFEYLMGFRGQAVFFESTDENLEDWAEYVYEDGDTFISAWFDSIRDWIVMAMDGSVLSVGDTKSEALARLLNQSASYPKRQSTKTRDLGYAWGWKNTFTRRHIYTGYLHESE